MPATFDTARDEILGAFTVKWNADTPAVNGGLIPEIFYEGIGEEGDKPHDAAWARIQIRHNLGEQQALGPSTDRRRFTKLGIVTVQIFAPLEKGLGLSLAEELAKVAKAAFEGKSTTSAVWFRNVSINEIGVDSAWYNMNVVAEFRYDEFV